VLIALGVAGSALAIARYWRKDLHATSVRQGGSVHDPSNELASLTSGVAP